MGRDKVRILVAEDEGTLSFFLKKSLEEDKRYEVEVIDSGDKALKKVTEDSYDLVIADQRLPGLSGLHLIQAVRVLSPKTKAILMTAYATEGIVAEVLRLKVEAFISKPFPMEQMVALVNRATKSKS